MTESIAAVIPAQGNDPEIRGRNLLPFRSGTLLSEKIKTLRQSDAFDSIVVSTESQEVAEIAVTEGVDVHFREADLSGADAKFNDLVCSVSRDIKFDHLAWCPVTAPLLTKQDYKKAKEQYFMSLERGYDSLITGLKEKRYLLDDSGPLSFRFDILKRSRDQLPAFYEFVNAISISPRMSQLEWRYNWGHRPYILELPKYRLTVVCSESDYRFVNYISEYSDK